MQGQGQEEQGEDQMNLLSQRVESKECMYEEDHRNDGTVFGEEQHPCPRGHKEEGWRFLIRQQREVSCIGCWFFRFFILHH